MGRFFAGYSEKTPLKGIARPIFRFYSLREAAGQKMLNQSVWDPKLKFSSSKFCG